MIIVPTINTKQHVFHTFSYKQFHPRRRLQRLSSGHAANVGIGHIWFLWHGLNIHTKSPSNQKNAESQGKVKDVIYTYDMLWQ